jgi:hypothetical protein
MSNRVLVRWCLSSAGASSIAFVSFTACTGGPDGPFFGDAGSSGATADVVFVDATTRPPQPPPLPTNTSTPDSSVPPVDSGTCKKSGITYTPIAINAPAPKSVSCNDSQIAALADACFKQPDSVGCATARSTYATCASCAFGQKSDAQWKPILLNAGTTPFTPASYNQAGCIELASGVKDCGKKYFTVVACFDAYCASCVGAEETACQKDVAQGSGECKQYLIDQTCGNALDAVETTCFAGEQTDAALKKLFVNMVGAACK